MLVEFHRLSEGDSRSIDVRWITCPGDMGADCLISADITAFETIDLAPDCSGATRTCAAVRQYCKRAVDIIVFCGGDGTARDICLAKDPELPMLGIPAGVKMFSGVFGVNPVRSAWILLRFLLGEIGTASADIMDLDENAYREGRIVARLKASSLVPREPSYTQPSKQLINASDDVTVKRAISEYLIELMNLAPDLLYVLGPGSTVEAVGSLLGIRKTLLGVDAVSGGVHVGKDLNENALLSLLQKYRRAVLIVSPIGAQGFVLGRGNQQLSPEVIRNIGTDNVMIISTPAKLDQTRQLRFDTGDYDIDNALAAKGFIDVITGYRRRRAVPVSR